MDALTLVVSAAVALQALQTAQIVILRRDVRDVRRTLYPPPIQGSQGARCAVCGSTPPPDRWPSNHAKNDRDR